MNRLPDEIIRKWGHSFEEDIGDITVYRSSDYEFPRGAVAAGIEFSPDGRFVDWLIAPTDAQRGVSGHWQVEAPGRVRVSFEMNALPPRILEIVECNAEILKVRQRPAER